MFQKQLPYKEKLFFIRNGGIPGLNLVMAATSKDIFMIKNSSQCEVRDDYDKTATKFHGPDRINKAKRGIIFL